MARDALTADVVRLVQDTAFDLDGEVTAESSFEELGMDSLTRVDLLAAVEKTYQLSVPDDTVATLLRVRDVVDFLVEAKAGV
ncbi:MULTISPECIES: acyl carrier protein [unclassified Streptomyces]|uniref:acyl carrier protein n=1 Tax=unclassified Streptomyces TaxID=2593676 RepID=UPI001110F5F4|nr:MULTISPECIES: phosphopantetheine-binding protein [unclassified Streptomyces]MCI3929127.1 phosphopantetheine-binding protein [Streptomyces sp. AN091965]QCX75029.1 Acyl carrier protein [Streptomyces sp. YIM 121038]